MAPEVERPNNPSESGTSHNGNAAVNSCKARNRIRKPGENGPAAESTVGRDKVDGDGRAAIDDQDVAPGPKNRDPDRGGEPVAPQRMGREVIAGDGHGRLRSELQARNPLCPNGGGDIGGIAPGRGRRWPREQEKPRSAPREQPPKTVRRPVRQRTCHSHNGQLDPGITNIDYEIHNSRKVL